MIFEKRDALRNPRRTVHAGAPGQTDMALEKLEKTSRKNSRKASDESAAKPAAKMRINMSTS